MANWRTDLAVAGAVAATGAVTGSNLSGTNTGDQTTITGNAATATTLQTARTINGVSFNGAANITVGIGWGSITGTLSSQGDLNTALAGKSDVGGTTNTWAVLPGASNANAPGATWAAVSTTTTNTPFAAYGALWTFNTSPSGATTTAASGVWLRQYFFETGGRTYNRQNINNGGWSAWAQVWDAAAIPLSYIAADTTVVHLAGTETISGAKTFSSTLTVNAEVLASGAGGFASSTYVTNSRNPIWRFGNADGYGISYFQGTAGWGGTDGIGIHFGTATAAGSAINFSSNGGVYITGSNGLTLAATGNVFSRAAANSTTVTNQPRVFVQSADPGAAAADGDLWVW